MDFDSEVGITSHSPTFRHSRRRSSKSAISCRSSHVAVRLLSLFFLYLHDFHMYSYNSVKIITFIYLFIYRDIIIIGCHLLRRHEIHFWSFMLFQLYPSFNWLLLIFIAIACFSAPSHWSIILCSWPSDILSYEQLSS